MLWLFKEWEEYKIWQHIIMGNWRLYLRLSFLFTVWGAFSIIQGALLWDSNPLHEGTFLRLPYCWMNRNVQVEQEPVGSFTQPSPTSPCTQWPEPTPSWAVTRCAAGLCRMNGHSHIAPGSVCWRVCVHVLERGGGSWKRRESVVIDVAAVSGVCPKQMEETTVNFPSHCVHI